MVWYCDHNRFVLWIFLSGAFIGSNQVQDIKSNASQKDIKLPIGTYDQRGVVDEGVGDFRSFWDAYDFKMKK